MFSLFLQLDELALHHIYLYCFRYFHRVRQSFMYAADRDQCRWLQTIGRFKKEADIHYLAVKRIFRYLCNTISDGLHYWRPTLNRTLPNAEYPSILNKNHDLQTPHSSLTQHIGFTASDWVGDMSHRWSISGLCLCFAGAPVVYRARFQSTVSQFSTEAEFIVAVEAGKLALYLRSILNDLGFTPG